MQGLVLDGALVTTISFRLVGMKNIMALTIDKKRDSITDSEYEE
jgi:hypothetical protein